MNTGPVKDQLLAEQRAYYSALALEGLPLPASPEGVIPVIESVRALAGRLISMMELT